MRDTTGKYSEASKDKFYLPLHKAIQSSFLDLEEVISGNRDISVPFIVGAPGGGKTSTIREECKKRGWNLYARNMGMTVNEELSGIPELIHEESESGKTYPTCLWSKPQLVSDVEALAAEAPTVIFFDDWHRTNSVIQSLAFESFTDYSLKGFKLPDNVAFILAGNDSVAAGARDQLSAVMNRVSKKYVKTDYKQWKNDYGFENVHPFILGFLDAEVNRDFFHMEESMYEPWASPRSWSYLSKKIKLMEARNIEQDENTRLAEYTSYVGKTAAAELLKYYLFYKNINVEEIFKTGEYSIPTSTIEQYIFSSLVNAHYLKLWDEDGEDGVDAKGRNLREVHSRIYLKILMEMFKENKEIGAIYFGFLRDKRPTIPGTLVAYKMISNDFLTSLYKLNKTVNDTLR